MNIMVKGPIFVGTWEPIAPFFISGPAVFVQGRNYACSNFWCSVNMWQPCNSHVTLENWSRRIQLTAL